MDFVLDLIFRPLARLCMARGMRFADVAERLRLAYLDMALETAGEDATDSKLSVMTGLQRRDVARLRAQEAPAPPGPDPLSRLVALWLTQHDGQPLPSHGAGSFDALARDIRRDIHPKSLRDALEAAGTVAVDGQKVRLLRRAHVPKTGSPEQLDYLARNVGDHLSVSVGNVLGEGASFDLAVHYSDLSDAAARELETLWRARMQPVFEEVSARAAALQDSDPGPHRVRGGGYFRIGASE